MRGLQIYRSKDLISKTFTFSLQTTFSQPLSAKQQQTSIIEGAIKIFVSKFYAKYICVYISDAPERRSEKLLKINNLCLFFLNTNNIYVKKTFFALYQ